MRENREREWEIERERATLLAGQANSSARPTLRGDLFNLLPKMTNDDPVAFFSAFKRALLLNGIDKTEWPRFLPSSLTVKANKVLAGLSLEENRDYEACKQAVLTSVLTHQLDLT